MADENNTGDEQFTPDGSMEPLSPQEADTTDYGLMDTGERIQRKDLQQEMRESYLAYALSVIVERALPDVRDGMKPVHRRVIYAMYDGGYRPDRGYNKCSRVVGDVMGKYHPHGDSAIYNTLVRMAQSWSMRNMLVDGQGNFGSPGDDPAAAMRYTECRMAPLAMEMVRDIDKDTVDFVPNYDGKTQEPTVLPARFPNLLVNGSAGIAVGMATNIPPHNMREVADGVHWALDHPDASREELLENLIRIIKGPDFPTGATILGHKGIEQAYRTGRGLITMRAVVNTEEINGRMCLVVTELPYQVNPDRLVVSIREAVRDGKIQGIADMRDETSGRTGQRLVLVLKRLHPPLGEPPARRDRPPHRVLEARGRRARPHPAGLSEGPRHAGRGHRPHPCLRRHRHRTYGPYGAAGHRPGAGGRHPGHAAAHADPHEPRQDRGRA